MWDQRYGDKSYVYGTEPNDFLRENAQQIPKGKILCLAEGEGRNAVWLAQQGYEVTAVDSSKIGLQKAEQLALERGVSISTVCADLGHFDMGVDQWDGIVSIFCHLPKPLRQRVHSDCIAALRSGAVMLLEAYTPQQLTYKTGGPPVAEMMMDSTLLKTELEGLEFLHLKECVRDIHEGELHSGPGAVVQLLARKHSSF